MQLCILPASLVSLSDGVSWYCQWLSAVFAIPYFSLLSLKTLKSMPELPTSQAVRHKVTAKPRCAVLQHSVLLATSLARKYTIPLLLVLTTEKPCFPLPQIYKVRL